MQFAITYSLLTLAVEALFVGRVYGQQCPLTRADIEPRNHVFLADNNLMREPVVPPRSRLTLACRNNIATDHECLNGVLTPPLPTTNCADRLKPEIVNGRAADCPPPYTLYIVRFGRNGHFTELYRSCYDKTKINAKYVEHVVYRNPFETNRPNQEFTLDGVITGAQAATYDARNVYDRFIQLLGINQGYVEGVWDYVINRGHLAPSADFLFMENKRATFKYINLMPQFGRHNNGNWKKIEEWVRTQNTNSVTVRAGTIGVLRLPHADDPTKMVPMYLGDRQTNPIPMWIYKVVNTVAFLVYNNPFATSLPNYFPCPEITCPAIGLDADFRLGYTYCCHANALYAVVNG